MLRELNNRTIETANLEENNTLKDNRQSLQITNICMMNSLNSKASAVKIIANPQECRYLIKYAHEIQASNFNKIDRLNSSNQLFLSQN
jgi:hypothetical protein